MTATVTDGVDFSSKEIYAVQNLVELPSEVRLMNQADFCHLLETRASEIKSAGHTESLFNQGVLVADLSQVQSTPAKPEPTLHRDFSKLGRADEILSFAAHHGFLGSKSELGSCRLDNDLEFVFEPISNWRNAVTEIALLIRLMELRDIEDDYELALLTGGFLGPHRIAYEAVLNDDGFNLGLVIPQTFFEISTFDWIKPADHRITAGLVNIGTGRSTRAPLKYPAELGVLSHVYEFLNNRLSRIVDSHQRFTAVTKALSYSGLECAGLRGLVAKQLIEELVNPELYPRCQCCLEPFFLSKSTRRFCSDRCRKWKDRNP